MGLLRFFFFCNSWASIISRNANLQIICSKLNPRAAQQYKSRLLVCVCVHCDVLPSVNNIKANVCVCAFMCVCVCMCVPFD